METIVGIDLGTTNSEIAALVDGKVRVIGAAGAEMLASCVGLSPAGELLVGAAARNQALLYPERTVRSIKRRMGTPDPVTLGDRSLTPPEVSALILRQLVAWAQPVLGARPGRAVITVPAYFSDVQRQATREAGALAGLEVVRILNEPTAASLAYGAGADARTSLVYDLGGGTFDVSVVRQERDVTEVLASHGNNHLGGDDFTDLLVGHLAEAFARSSGVDVRQGHPAALARLWWAAEAAKQRLSAEPYARVVEESLVIRKGVALHLDHEVSRAAYEELIRDLVASTVASVRRAMADAGTLATALDDVLLVGGSSRTPLVQERLRELTGRAPRAEVNPDLCVALGAGIMASRLAGHDVDRVLVDISPYAFGISHLGERDGRPYPYCFRPTIPRNSALPVTRTESYFTAAPYQPAVEFQIFQGDDPDALRNVPVGAFLVSGLSSGEEPNEVLCRMRLDLDGILTVTALEKRTGLSKAVTIEQALRQRSAAEIAAARARLERLFVLEPPRAEDDEVEVDDALAPVARLAALPPEPVADAAAPREARALLERSRGLLDRMHPDDQEEAIGLHQAIEQALAAGDAAALDAAVKTLGELVFFVEGR